MPTHGRVAQFADQDSVEENLRVGGAGKTCSQPAYSTDFRVNSSLKRDVEAIATREGGVDLRSFSPGWIGHLQETGCEVPAADAGTVKRKAVE